MIGDFINVKSSGDFLKVFLIFLIVVLIHTILVRLLWNGVLVKHISILRPVETLLETFLLSIALTMFHGRCVN